MTQIETMNRRAFLKGAAALGAALALPVIIPSSALGADGAVAPSNRIVLGHIGVGSKGMADLKGFLNHSGVQVAAVCDVDSARAAAAQKLVNEHYGTNGCAAYRDFRELTARPDIDAVVIVTPDHWHVLTALDAVRHGKDAYVEKPLSLTIEEGRVLADTARRYGRIVQTGSQQRSSNYFRSACELVRNGRIGKLQEIIAYIPSSNRHNTAWQPEPVPPELDYDMWLGQAPWEPYTKIRCHYAFRFIRDYAGGQVTNFGAHNIDIGQWALGMDASGPVEVSGHGDYPAEGIYNTPDNVRFECTYENGARMVCQTRKPGDPNAGADVAFIGSTGTILASRGSLRATPEKLLREEIGPGEINLYRSRDHFQNFLDCIRSRRLPIADVEIGHRSATICHLGNMAMLLGRKVRWDPKTEKVIGDETAQRLCSRSMRAPWRL